MIQKPEIQYVGQFYVHGSEARALEPRKQQKKPKTRLPLARLEKIETITIDPVAIASIAVAVVMLIAMVLGLVRLYSDWTEYERMSDYVSELKKENADLAREYRDSYDLEDVRSKALGMGLVPADQVQTRTVYVTMPEPEPETTWFEELVWFWNGLWE